WGKEKETNVQTVQVTQRGGPAVLKMMPLPDAVPGEGQVVVKVEAIGVNYVDILARRGTYPRVPSPPFVPGIEMAGTVSRVGPKVSGAQVGDRIVGLAAGGGGYAEYVLMSAALIYPIPGGVSFEDAAAHFIVFTTAYHCLKFLGRVQSGESVLVRGWRSGDSDGAARQTVWRTGARLREP